MCLVSCRLQSRLEDMKIGYRLPENNYSQQAIDFMDKVLDISGLGDATFLSDGTAASCPPPMLLGSHACCCGHMHAAASCPPPMLLGSHACCCCHMLLRSHACCCLLPPVHAAGVSCMQCRGASTRVLPV